MMPLLPMESYSYFLVLCLFQVVLGGTIVMCAVSFGKESLSRSLSICSTVHVDVMFCLGRRGGEMGDGGSVSRFFLEVAGS
jgi:hypothetical protein